MEKGSKPKLKFIDDLEFTKTVKSSFFSTILNFFIVFALFFKNFEYAISSITDLFNLFLNSLLFLFLPYFLLSLIIMTARDTLIKPEVRIRLRYYISKINYHDPSALWGINLILALILYILLDFAIKMWGSRPLFSTGFLCAHLIIYFLPILLGGSIYMKEYIYLQGFRELVDIQYRLETENYNDLLNANIPKKFSNALKCILKANDHVKYFIKNEEISINNLAEIFLLKDSKKHIELKFGINRIINAIENQDYMNIILSMQQTMNLRSDLLKNAGMTENEEITTITRGSSTIKELFKKRQEFPEYKEIFKLFVKITETVIILIITVILGTTLLMSK